MPQTSNRVVGRGDFNMPNLELIKFTDEQLTDELMWRGWKLGESDRIIYGADRTYRVGEMSSVVFLEHLLREYGVTLSAGGLVHSLLDALLKAYPGSVHWETLINHCYGSSASSPIDARNCIRATVCRVRQDLAPTIYTIATVWSYGYQLKVK